MKFYSILASSLISTGLAQDQEAATCEAGQPCQQLYAGLKQKAEQPGGNSVGGPRVTEKKDGSISVKGGTLAAVIQDLNDGNDVPVTEAPVTPTVKPRFGLQFQIPVINNYGCWCYGGQFWPGARDMTGTGPHMDIYDDACKAHHMGFDCIVADADAEGETCVPNETAYSLLITPQANGDYTIECDDDIADDWCKRRTCLVDIRFIARHWKLEKDEIFPDYETYGHSGFHDNAGDFDTDVCVVPVEHHGPGGHTRSIVKVCCGEYPYRIWYDKNNNRGTKCCEYNDAQVNADYGFNIKIGQLYNKMANTCCPYGVISDNLC